MYTRLSSGICLSPSCTYGSFLLSSSQLLIYEGIKYDTCVTDKSPTLGFNHRLTGAGFIRRWWQLRDRDYLQVLCPPRQNNIHTLAESPRLQLHTREDMKKCRRYRFILETLRFFFPLSFSSSAGRFYSR